MTFARVSAVVGLKIEDYYPEKKRWWVRLYEKNGAPVLPMPALRPRLGAIPSGPSASPIT